MSLEYKENNNNIYTGDSLEILKTFDENSVDAIITDPPYGLSFMGMKWDYDVPSTEIWQECLRVLKPGGYLLAFAGTRTQHRMAVRIEDAGFEIRDMIAWVYSTGFPKSLNIGKAIDKIQGNEREIVGINKNGGMSIENGMTFRDDNWKPETRDLPITKGTSEWEGWGTALKPALEPITVARKPLSEKTVAENVLKWGVGGINIDGCRVETGDNLNGGSYGNTNRIEDKFFKGKKPAGAGTFVQPDGRFPANLIHDGSEEVLSLFPETKSVQSQRGKVKIFKKDNSWIGESTLRGHNDSGSASRFFYCAKASKSERNKGLEGMPLKAGGSNAKGYTKDVANGLDRNRPVENFHPTVKPVKLMEYLIKLVTKENYTVLDPFMGSGTTGIACKRLNRNFIGVELNEEYAEIAKKRIESVSA